MAQTEDAHRHRPIDAGAKRVGDTIPLIRREHVSGLYARRPVWLAGQVPLARIREIVAGMERGAGRFHEKAAQRTSDAGWCSRRAC